MKQIYMLLSLTLVSALNSAVSSPSWYDRPSELPAEHRNEVRQFEAGQGAYPIVPPTSLEDSRRTWAPSMARNSRNATNMQNRYGTLGGSSNTMPIGVDTQSMYGAVANRAPNSYGYEPDTLGYNQRRFAYDVPQGYARDLQRDQF